MERIRTQFGSDGLLGTLKEGDAFLGLTMQTTTSYFSSKASQLAKAILRNKTQTSILQPEPARDGSSLSTRSQCTAVQTRNIKEISRNTQGMMAEEGLDINSDATSCGLCRGRCTGAVLNIRMQLEYHPEEIKQIQTISCRPA